MNKPSLNSSTIISKLTEIIAKVSRFKLVLFIIMVGAVYGYILFTIGTLTNAQPSDAMVQAQNDPIASARIDKKVISQLRQLEDNSVSVKELFDDARDNPFQE